MNRGRVSTNQIEAARSVDLVALVGQRVKLIRKGNVWWGLCPFHPEKNPSFKVEREFFKCFGCGKGGDIFVWLKEVEGLSFLDAVKRLSGDTATAQPQAPAAEPLPAHKRTSGPDERTPGAMEYWHEAKRWQGFLGERFFFEHRQLDVRGLDLSHCLRWHARERALIWLMTDAVTAVPVGVHRTYLNADGSKHRRLMKGPAGIIRLSPDDSVTYGLGIAEGVENSLAVLISGWEPVWSCVSAGGIGKFPVLAGIDALTIFPDLGPPIGMAKAEECAARWRDAGREVLIVPPVAPGSPLTHDG